jgi:type IV pilus assembly protein PilB
LLNLGRNYHMSSTVSPSKLKKNKIKVLPGTKIFPDAQVSPDLRPHGFRIGRRLIEAGLITEKQLKIALNEQKIHKGLIGSILIRLGFIQENDLIGFLSQHYGVPRVDINAIEIAPEVLRLVPTDLIKKHHILPISHAASTLVIAVSDPANYAAIDDIRFFTGFTIDTVVVEESTLKGAIEKHFGQPDDLHGVIGDLEELELELVGAQETEPEVNLSELEKETAKAPVVRLVNVILAEAIKRQASDIHIEPYEKQFRVRYRIDGVLYEILHPPVRLIKAVVSRIKIMASLNIAERRLPQDGRIKLKTSGKEMDLRVSVLPTLFGEKIVLRLLDKEALQLDMRKLGFEKQALADFQRAIHKPHGLVLVTGPTGSGKTTTLYSALSELNKATANISTAEDPIEYYMQGINQVQIHEEIGLDFAVVLKAFLRQDPDIILVGEIRDLETAEIAVKAALTGHLVLSSLHTNDAPGTVSRLLNMGIEPFLLTSSINIIIAQRLIRKVCEKCKIENAYIPEKMAEFDLLDQIVADGTKLVKTIGCKYCGHTGYKGRIALYEVMVLHDEIKALILKGGSVDEIRAAAQRLGMRTLRQSGLQKIEDQLTTVDEVIQATV